MSGGAAAYLVFRREDGYGDVVPLHFGQRYSLGRAHTCRIVLKDELCSREHAEIYYADGRWRLRDQKSLNGTRVNGESLYDDERPLAPGDDVQLGRTPLIFVEDLSQLPSPPPAKRRVEGLEIKRRLGKTRFQTPLPPIPPGPTATGDATPALLERRSLSRDLSLLYRLALDMGQVLTFDELVRIVLEGLLEAIPAEVAAILTIKEAEDPETVQARHRDPQARGYARVPPAIVDEVLASKHAVLAEDVARDTYLRSPASQNEAQATSLICAPVVVAERVTGLIYLYCTDPHRALAAEDLEFAMAVAKHFGMISQQVQRQDSLYKENQVLRDQLRIESELVGSSSGIRNIEHQIGRVASTNATVLIRGESGSGKELVARAIHYSSPRRDGPFVCLNCAALSETLLESELFGHEKGAFTGATERKIGKFESADHGTIFLDEIGEMNSSTQAKLLRVLEGHPFERVGGNVSIRVDVRVVAATNQPLETFLREKRFRPDLYYRLQVVEIRVPPLRERKSDVPVLADHFLRRFARDTGRKIRGFTPAALKKMEEYHWPGNVRELRNVVERAVALSNGTFLDARDIWLSSLDLDGPAPPTNEAPAYKPLSIEDVEKEHILRTLQHTEWNKSQAASILNIERSTLDRKIKAYDLKR
jgi:transcriptional regulator with GAF, ATPase, and Fis domain